MTDAPCPALADLLADEPIPGVAEHAAGCVRCRALVASTHEQSGLTREPAAETERPTPVSAAPGGIVLVSSDSADELLPAVVLAVSEETATIAPLSAEVWGATEWDLLLPPSEVGYPAAVQVWNTGTVLLEQLQEVIGALGRTAFEQLAALARAAAASAVPPADAAVGAPVLNDEDPRLLVQDEQAETARLFWQPALALAGAATLGQLVRHRRTQFAEAEAEPWVESLERDELDIPRALSAQALAALLRRLGLAGSRRLREIARATIEAHAPATARGGSQVSAAAENARYLDELMDALEHNDR
jgi:hypothetical protein